MGVWQAFHCCQHMACNESHGYVRISNFLRLAYKQTFVASPSRSSLATFVHNLPCHFCNIPSPGSVPAQLAACVFHHHTCRTGMVQVNINCFCMTCSNPSKCGGYRGGLWLFRYWKCWPIFKATKKPSFV